MMKKVLCLVCSILLVLSFTGCTAGGSSHIELKGELYPDGTQDELELTMWLGGTQWKGDYLTIIKGFVDNFNDGKLGDAANKLNLKINYEIIEDISTQLSTAVYSSETCPNLMVWDRFNTPTYAYQDLLISIDGYLTDDVNDNTKIYKGAYNQEALSELNYYSIDEEDSPRHYYGLPIDIDTWGIYVNLDAVKAHNVGLSENDPSYVDINRLDKNWTWYDLYDISQRLTNKANSVYGYQANSLQAHYYKFFVSTEQEFLKDDLTPNIDNDKGRNSLKFIHDLVTAGVSRNNVEDNHFYNGEVVMYNMPTYFGQLIEKSGRVDEYLFLPQPRYNDWKTGADFTDESGVMGINGGMMGGFGLAMPLIVEDERTDKYYETQKRAMQFINWWANGDGAKQWSICSQTLPAKTALHTDNDILSKSQVVSSASGFVNNYKARPNVRGFESFCVNITDVYIDSFLKTAYSQAALDKAVSNIINNSKSYLAK